MFETFVHQFLQQMSTSPEKLALVCITDDGTEQQVSRAQFLAMVQGQARSLQVQGISEGDVLLIVLPHGMDLFTTFWAAVLLGAIPVIYPSPRILEAPQAYLETLGAFVLQIQSNAVLIVDEISGKLEPLLKDSATRILPLGALTDIPAGTEIVPARVSSLENTALIQFSSGSTGAKKGVVISHRAMDNYLAVNKTTMRLSPDDVVVSWLPLNHDMGLIASFIVPLTSGFPAVLMSPGRWMAQPDSLFQAVHRYRGTITLMPNFAFGYCTKQVRDEQIEGVDLSCWRILISGGEPVRIGILDKFSERFSAFGLNRTALRVGYGMAECVLGISRTPLDEYPKVDWIDQRLLIKDHQATACDSSDANARCIVSCGRTHPMVEAQIVDDAGLQLPERQVGEVRVKSTAFFSGYHLQPEMTAAAFTDGWLNTGDLGYLHDGELFVCGRKKDVIICFGNNIYPEDVEEIAGSFAQIRKGRAVAFGVSDEARGTEKIVLVCELVNDSASEERNLLVNRIREQVWERLDVLLSTVKFVERGWVVKTTSGKLARSANREKYLSEL